MRSRTGLNNNRDRLPRGLLPPRTSLSPFLVESLFATSNSYSEHEYRRRLHAPGESPLVPNIFLPSMPEPPTKKICRSNEAVSSITTRAQARKAIDNDGMKLKEEYIWLDEEQKMANPGNKLDTADVESLKLKEMLEIEQKTSLTLRAELDKLRAERESLLRLIVDAREAVTEAIRVIRLQYNLVVVMQRVWMQGVWSGRGGEGP